MSTTTNTTSYLHVEARQTPSSDDPSALPFDSNPTWTPPPLRAPPIEGEPGHSWLGKLSRFELVKGLLRCGSADGKPLSEASIDKLVKMQESMEEHMLENNFELVVNIGTRFVQGCQNCTWVWFTLSLAMLASCRSATSSDTDRALRCLRTAIVLEPENTPLSVNADLVLRIVSGVPTLPDQFSVATAPKSSGHIQALVAIAQIFVDE